eukprot:6314504-Lingulodinium_polyedra.AAC.1
MGCKISPKSAGLATNQDLLEEVVADLKGEGITIKKSMAARDLGIDATAGVRRRLPVFKARLAKAMQR